MRVFISYAKTQGPIADRVVAACAEKDVSVHSRNLWLFFGHKPDAHARMLNELRTYDRVVILWSKEHAQNKWLQREVFAILTIQEERDGKFVHLLDCDGTPVPGTLDTVSTFIVKDRLDEGIAELASCFPDHKQLFVVMAFDQGELDSAYQTIMKPTAKRFGFHVRRADEPQNSESIPLQILRLIEGSRIVLCDLSEPRPNVYFEAGYALALGKDMILTARKGSTVHFDLGDRRRIIWETPWDLASKLAERLESLVKSADEA